MVSDEKAVCFVRMVTVSLSYDYCTG